MGKERKIEPLLWRDNECATALGFSRATFRKLVSAGRAPEGIKIGRNRRWAVAEIRKWVENLKRGR